MGGTWRAGGTRHMKFLYLSWKVGQPESHREDFSQEESKRESSWSQEQAQHPERDREIIPQLNPSTPLPHHAHSLPSASPPRALLQRPVARLVWRTRLECSCQCPPSIVRQHCRCQCLVSITPPGRCLWVPPVQTKSQGNLQGQPHTFCSSR